MKSVSTVSVARPYIIAIVVCLATLLLATGGYASMRQDFTFRGSSFATGGYRNLTRGNVTVSGTCTIRRLSDNALRTSAANNSRWRLQIGILRTSPQLRVTGLNNHVNWTLPQGRYRFSVNITDRGGLSANNHVWIIPNGQVRPR